VLTAAAARAISRARILVVDDSPIIRESMQLKLQALGYAADLAESGEDALNLMLKKSFQVIFLDVVMRGMDGYEVCKRIKKGRDTKKTRVVMLTTKGKTFDKIKGAMAGRDAYLIKPIDEAKMRALLQEYLPPINGLK
jgi:two-component system, cell cycle response regulator